jgi:hypothetical protein
METAFSTSSGKQTIYLMKKHKISLLPVDPDLMEALVREYISEQIKMARAEQREITKKLKNRKLTLEARDILISDLADSQEFEAVHQNILSWYREP